MRHESGGWYLTKILPYRTSENLIEGAILTFIDTTAQRETRDELLAARVFENVAQNVREPIILLDKDLRVEFANNTFYSVFKVSSSETLNRKVYSLGNGQWNIPELKKLLEGILPKKKQLSNYRIEHKFDHIGSRVMMLNATAVAGKNNVLEKILLTITDVTEKKEKAG